MNLTDYEFGVKAAREYLSSLVGDREPFTVSIYRKSDTGRMVVEVERRDANGDMIGVTSEVATVSVPEIKRVMTDAVARIKKKL